MIISPGKFAFDAEFPTSILRNKVAEIHAKGVHHFIVPGVYERSMIDWALQFIKPESTFIDIGAHIGSWSLIASRRAKRVESFEPQRLLFYQLCGNVALNNLENVYVHNIGLGNRTQRNTKQKITKFGVDWGSSSLRSEVVDNMKTLGAPITGVEEITIKSLDDFTFNSVSLIKIDVEGYELHVLEGAVQTIKEHQPTMVIEVWNNPTFKKDRDAVLKFIESINYVTHPVNGYQDYLLCTPK